MKNYVNLELTIVLIENVDVVTASPFTGETDGFGDPNEQGDPVGNF